MDILNLNLCLPKDMNNKMDGPKLRRNILITYVWQTSWLYNELLEFSDKTTNKPIFKNSSKICTDADRQVANKHMKMFPITGHQGNAN